MRVPTPRAGGIVTVLALGLLVVACGAHTSSSAGSASTPVTAADLDGSTFESTSSEGHDLVAGSSVRLTFDQGSLSANAGCNTMSASYDVTDGKLAWSGTPAATMMGCPDESMNQDTWLIGFLQDGAEATLDGDELKLTAGDVTLTLTRQKEESAADLMGHKWTVTGLIDGSRSSSLPAGVDAPTLDIAADGSVQVFTGCNRGHTQVTVEGDTLHFAPVATTKMACPGDAAQVEQAVLKALDGDVHVTGDAATATLNNGQHGLMMTTG